MMTSLGILCIYPDIVFRRHFERVESAPRATARYGLGCGRRFLSSSLALQHSDIRNHVRLGRVRALGDRQLQHSRESLAVPLVMGPVPLPSQIVSTAQYCHLQLHVPPTAPATSCSHLLPSSLPLGSPVRPRYLVMRSVAILLQVLGDILSCELGNVVDYRGCEQALLRAVTNQSISYKEEPQECSITRE